jgi:macrolide transport system ATP-binding/permease protein
MKRLRAWGWRLAGLFTNNRRERELADEIESHLQMHIDDNIRSGMTPEQARRNAILKLGGIESTKEAYRDGSTIPFLENLVQGVRYAIRQLRKNPGFTCTSILMLALGLCASVAIFAFVDATLIKPLPYPDPTRLVGVTERSAMFPRANLSYPDYLDWKRFNKVFSSLDVYVGTGYMLSTPAGTEVVPGERVSDGFFRTLGIAPVLGRSFYSGEDLPGAPNAVMLSYDTWQKRYGGSKDVIGQTVRLSGVPYGIAGVLPRDFQFAPRGRAEFWTIFHASGECDLRRSCHDLDGIARLKDGVSVQTALADMTSIAQQLEKQYPGSNRGQGANVLPLSETIIGNIRPILLVLLGGAGLLLLIACVNVASLLLVRSESRMREMAVRTALGASRTRLIRQFVTEGVVLVAAGSVLGLIAAGWTMQLLTRLIPVDMMARMPYLNGLGLNARVSALACAISLLAAMLFSVTPALRLSYPAMREGLAEGSRGSAGNTWRRLGSKLVVLELAITMVLLVGAGLLGQSLHHLLRVELGFQPDHLATLTVAVVGSHYAKDEQTVTLGRQIVSRVSTLSGVNSVGITSLLPVNFNGNTDWIRFVGRPYSGEHNEVNQRDVSAGYLTTLRAKLLRGRYFTDAEDASKPKVVIINQALARKYFPGEDPIGKQFGNDELSPKSLKTIVGIVDDIKEGPLDSDIWPAVYYPFNQSPDSSFSLVVRTSQVPQAVLPALTAAIHQIDPSVGTYGEATISGNINDSPSAYLHRSSAWLVGGFAALALLLSVVGFYGVVAYSVSQRTREIGVRMALGAERGTVCRLILKEAGWLTAFGIILGGTSSLAAATLMRNLLFGIRSWDVPTLAAVAAVLGISALLASYIPARRAASVNPVEALRAE